MITANRQVQQKASHKVKAAIKVGKLKEETCALCDKDITEAHHPDYTKPLFVIWLCHKCHRNHHEDIRAVDILPLLNNCIKTYLFEQNQRRIQQTGILRGINKRFSEICC